MGNRFFQTRWGIWLLFILGWTLLSLLFIPEVYLYFLYRREALPFTQILALTLVNAAIALIFLPPIVWLTRRFPIDRETWHKSLLIHIPCCLVFSLSHSW